MKNICFYQKKNVETHPQGTAQKLYLIWKLCASPALKNGVILVHSTLCLHGARDSRDHGGAPYCQLVVVCWLLVPVGN